MTQDEMDKRHERGLESIKNLLNYGGQYHHHKDQMIFGGVGLYLAACSFLIFNDEVRTESVEHPLTAWTLFAVSVCSAFLFLRAQYKWRRHAADLVRSCTSLSTLWLKSAPSDVDLEPTLWNNDRLLPKALVDEMNSDQQNRKWGDSLLVYGVSGLWTLFAAIRLFGAGPW